MRFSEKKSEELIGTNIQFSIPEEDREAVILSITSLTKKSPIKISENRNIRHDGEIRWLRWTDRALFDEKGKVISCQSFGEDITESKQAEEKLKISEERFRTFMENIPAMAYIKDSDLHHIYGNPASIAADEFQTLEEYIKTKAEDSLPEEIAQEVENNDKRVLEEKCHTSQEYTRILDDGKEQTVLDIKFPIQLPDGVNQVGGLAIDITESKQAQKSIIQERDKAQKYLDIAEVMIVALNKEGEITLVNQKGASILGYKIEDLTGKNWFETCLLAADRTQAKKMFEDFMGSGVRLGTHFDQTIVTKSGEERIIDWHSTPLWEWDDEEKRRIGSLSSGEDITRRKRAEMELHQKSESIAILYGAGKQLGQTLNLDIIYKNLHGTISKIMTCDGLVISSYDSQTNSIRCVKMWHEGKLIDVSEFPLIPLEPAGQGTQSRAILSGESLYLDDYQKYFKSSKTSYFVDEEGNILNSDKVSVEEDITRSALIVPLIQEGEVIGVIQVFSYHKDDFSEDDLQFLEAFFPQVAAAITNAALYKLTEQSKNDLQKTVEGTIHLIAAIVEARDPYTAGHQTRVSDLAAAIAIEMKLTDEQVEGIKMAGIIHDLGKINIPAEILSKPGTLSELEYKIIQTHPQVGFDLLKNIEFPWPIAEMVHQHHEKMDGSGYPQGLKGDDILLEARILAVADIVEAMSSHRPYRPAHDIEKAFKQIKKDKGTLLDPKVVNACLKIFKEGYKLPEN